MASIHEMIEQLPPELQKEVRDFVEFLTSRRRSSRKREFSFQWRGALHDVRDQYGSVELQHRARQWWGE